MYNVNTLLECIKRPQENSLNLPSKNVMPKKKVDIHQ